MGQACGDAEHLLLFFPAPPPTQLHFQEILTFLQAKLIVSVRYSVSFYLCTRRKAHGLSALFLFGDQWLMDQDAADIIFVPSVRQTHECLCKNLCTLVSLY